MKRSHLRSIFDHAFVSVSRMFILRSCLRQCLKRCYESSFFTHTFVSASHKLYNIPSQGGGWLDKREHCFKWTLIGNLILAGSFSGTAKEKNKQIWWLFLGACHIRSARDLFYFFFVRVILATGSYLLGTKKFIHPHSRSQPSEHAKHRSCSGSVIPASLVRRRERDSCMEPWLYGEQRDGSIETKKQ